MSTSASLFIPGIIPEVETVKRLAPIWKFSLKISIAFKTLSKFKSGSPCPINTTFVTFKPVSLWIVNTCSIISLYDKFLIKPRFPVAQNEQFTAQPTCELTQAVKFARLSNLIKTVSTHSPSGYSSKYFNVPSELSCLTLIFVSVTVATCLSCSLNLTDKSVISSIDLTDFRYIQL